MDLIAKMREVEENERRA